jgi:hypothetical protein
LLACGILDFAFFFFGGARLAAILRVALPRFELFSRVVQIPVHRGQSFRRIADSIPMIADSF